MMCQHFLSDNTATSLLKYKKNTIYKKLVASALAEGFIHP